MRVQGVVKGKKCQEKLQKREYLNQVLKEELKGVHEGGCVYGGGKQGQQGFLGNNSPLIVNGKQSSTGPMTEQLHSLQLAD